MKPGPPSRDAIRELAQRIAREFAPDRIILFGSHARGEPSAESDVDLLVVLPHSGKAWRLAAEIRARVRPPFPLDLLVREQTELVRRAASGDPFLREVLETGEVLYDRNHA